MRDCPGVVERVLKWRSTLLARQEAREENLFELFWGEPYERTIMQWPATPYLEIEPSIRHEYLTVHNAHGEITRKWLMAEQREKLAKLIKAGTLTSFVVRDWSASDTELLKQFKRWLEDTRPEETAIRETRGKAKLKTKMRIWLRALGAWRLSQVMSQNDVISFAIEHGKHLYRNQPDLSKQLTRTARYLVWLDKTEVDP